MLKLCKYGLLTFPPGDVAVGRSLQEYGEYSEDEAQTLGRYVKPGDTVVDVGANLGALTVPLARFVGRSGRVWAFEPQRKIHQFLVANTVLNDLPQVLPLLQAVGKEPGTIDVPELDLSPGENYGRFSLVDNRPQPGQDKAIIKLVTIDSLQLPSCALIKIDVEGMEPDVLEGARETIKRLHPVLYVEADRKESTPRTIKILRQLGYDVYEHKPAYFNPDNFTGNRVNCFGNTVSHNLLALPPGSPVPGGLTVANPEPCRIAVQVSADPGPAYGALLDLAERHSVGSYDADSAMKVVKLAEELCPGRAETASRAVNVLSRACRFQDALPWALQGATSGDVASVFNYGVTLTNLGRHQEAAEAFRWVVKKKPDWEYGHFHLACSLLALGDPEGWQEYEWRLKLPPIKGALGTLPDLPRWDGSSGKRVLVYIEQGAGDLFQWLAYVPLMKCHVIVACQQKVAPLVKEYPGVNEVMELRDGFWLDDVEADCMISVCSLPGMLGEMPVEPLKHLRRKTFHAVGICWAGGSVHENDHNRSCFLRDFKPLRKLNLVSLQKGDLKRQWPSVGSVDLAEGRLPMYSPVLKDWYTTAWVISNLRAVVTVDTAVAHVAGSIGVPTHLLLGWSPDWRWGTGDTTHWYPSVTLYRRQPGQEWIELVKQVAERLKES
jgi:FkbM family methyltransferase